MATRADIELAKLTMTFERGLDIDNRTIYIFDEIDDDLSEDVVKSLAYLSGTEGKIHIMINSQGGSVSDMFAVYDAMRACPNEIITIGLGEVCSAAALLLVAGDKRLASKNCLFMAHQTRGGVDPVENLSTVKAQLAATEVIWDRWAACMAEHTKHTKNYWKKEVPTKLNELWLTSEEMELEKHGIIDGVWE